MESVKTFPDASEMRTLSSHQHGLHILQENSQEEKAEPLDACLVSFLQDSSRKLEHTCFSMYT